MTTGDLGKVYQDGEVIIQQGEEGDCMYVIQQGQVEVTREKNGKEITLGTAKEGDFIGEMAIFEREVRSATVRAVGQVRVLTVDKKNFMRRVHEDPSIAYRLVKTLSQRIRNLYTEVDKYLESGSFTQTVRAIGGIKETQDEIDKD